MIQSEAQRLAGEPKFNIRAPADVSDVIFKRLRLPVPPCAEKNR